MRTRWSRLLEVKQYLFFFAFCFPVGFPGFLFQIRRRLFLALYTVASHTGWPGCSWGSYRSWRLHHPATEFSCGYFNTQTVTIAVVVSTLDHINNAIHTVPQWRFKPTRRNTRPGAQKFPLFLHGTNHNRCQSIVFYNEPRQRFSSWSPVWNLVPKQRFVILVVILTTRVVTVAFKAGITSLWHQTHAFTHKSRVFQRRRLMFSGHKAGIDLWENFRQFKS